MHNANGVIEASLISSHETLVQRLKNWAACSSWTYDATGMHRMADLLVDHLSRQFGFEVERRQLPSHQRVDDSGHELQTELGPLLVAKMRPEAKRQVLLGIHYDTVYGPSLAGPKVATIDDRLHGPGVADAKGGIVVLLEALAAFEKCPEAQKIGWELFLNPDEEIGSPGSSDYFASCRQRFDFAMLFEPALPDGGMAIHRKGSGNFVFIVRGKAAHAGRDFHSGRNAVLHAARLALALNDCNGRFGTSTFNVATLIGGSAMNVVPDLCVCRLNVRVDQVSRVEEIQRHLHQLVTDFNQEAGLSCELRGSITSPPKPPTESVWQLARQVDRLAKPLHQTPTWIETGGVCDGNKLAAVGIPTIDTFGPRGAELHSEREWVDLSSLVPRARLAASLLLAFARNEFDLPSPQ